jgi:integrase
MPKFPEIRFELAWRRTVDKETQSAIIDEVRRISWDINPKIWIGIKWLATYISIRPIELIQIREGDFDLGLGVVNVRYNKERRPKTVPMLDEDITLVRSFPTALPTLYFFRHGPRRGLPAAKRHRFGKDYLYSWWKQACANLGIAGVDLYGGTRHSSARALREYCSPEQIKRATMHTTNKAFERYFQIELDDIRAIYQNTKAEPPVNRKSVQPQRINLLKLVVKNGAEGGT